MAAMMAVMLAALDCSPQAAAQTYPSRQIKLIVPYSAGGIADLLARSVANELAPRLGQTIVIENRTGAGGHLGADVAVKAPADGYTLVLATIAHNAAQSLYSNLAYNPEKDLKPVILLAESAGVLVVHDSVKARSVPEFIALAKWCRPHLRLGRARLRHPSRRRAILALDRRRHCPRSYRGSAPAMNDLLGGQINAMFENIPPPCRTSRPARSGAQGDQPERAPSLPDTPTIAEAACPAMPLCPGTRSGGHGGADRGGGEAQSRDQRGAEAGGPLARWNAR
jgi:tripartite-type tricarboxylate transporter receptor subunit TctC